MTTPEVIEDLNYQSESDDLWTNATYSVVKGGITCSGLKKATMRAPLSGCEELDFSGKLDQLVNTQPQSAEYDALRTHLEETWTGHKAFKFTPSKKEGYNFDLCLAGMVDGQVEVLCVSGVET